MDFLHLLHPQLCHLSLENQVPLHQVLQHLQGSLQPDTRSKAAVELEGKDDRECRNDYHYRDVNGGEGELGKSRQLID